MKVVGNGEESAILLSRKLRNELEHLFERARTVNLFEVEEDELESMEEKFLVLVSGYPEDAFQEALLMTATSERTDANFSGRLPIHLACEDHNCPIGVIQWLLDRDVSRGSVLQPDRWGDLPIHTACSRNLLEVTRLLLQFDVEKRSIFVKDENGSLPIHMACRYNAGPDILALLLESDELCVSLYEQGIYGQLPLHVACRGGGSLEAVQVLLQYDHHKISVLKEDNVGRLAIHIYLLVNRSRHRNMDIVKLLLEAMICNRLHRVGLDNWKKTMYQLLSSLTKSYERDFVTRERLDAIAAQIKILLHRSFLLELAVWKASCLRGHHTQQFQSIQDIHTYCLQEQNFDPYQYKQDRLYLSGADQIVPHVLSFLEDEPILNLMQELN